MGDEKKVIKEGKRMKVWRIFDAIMWVLTYLIIALGISGGLIFLYILLNGGFNK